jgi:hypothetical protein
MEDEYPSLVEFMDKCLFQDPTMTFEDAIRQWLQTGQLSVDKVVFDIDKLLCANHNQEQIDSFVDKHSDFLEDGGGRQTLIHIRKTLESPG